MEPLGSHAGGETLSRTGRRVMSDLAVIKNPPAEASRVVGLRAKTFRVSRPRMSDLSSRKPVIYWGLGFAYFF
jgi:hypothetical protein